VKRFGENSSIAAPFFAAFRKLATIARIRIRDSSLRSE
jgi:hypothetical protein